MKKLLSILGVLGLTASTTTTVVSCNTMNDSEDSGDNNLVVESYNRQKSDLTTFINNLYVELIKDFESKIKTVTHISDEKYKEQKSDIFGIQSGILNNSDLLKEIEEFSNIENHEMEHLDIDELSKLANYNLNFDKGIKQKLKDRIAQGDFSRLFAGMNNPTDQIESPKIKITKVIYDAKNEESYLPVSLGEYKLFFDIGFNVKILPQNGSINEENWKTINFSSNELELSINSIDAEYSDGFRILGRAKQIIEEAKTSEIKANGELLKTTSISSNDMLFENPKSIYASLNSKINEKIKIGISNITNDIIDPSIRNNVKISLRKDADYLITNIEANNDSIINFDQSKIIEPSTEFAIYKQKNTNWFNELKSGQNKTIFDTMLNSKTPGVQSAQLQEFKKNNDNTIYSGSIMTLAISVKVDFTINYSQSNSENSFVYSDDLNLKINVLPSDGNSYSKTFKENLTAANELFNKLWIEKAKKAEIDLSNGGESIFRFTSQNKLKEIADELQRQEYLGNNSVIGPFNDVVNPSYNNDGPVNLNLNIKKQEDLQKMQPRWEKVDKNGNPVGGNGQPLTSETDRIIILNDATDIEFKWTLAFEFKVGNFKFPVSISIADDNDKIAKEFIKKDYVWFDYK